MAKQAKHAMAKNGKSVAGWFGCNTFNWRTMEDYLSKKTIQELRKVVDEGGTLPLGLADACAAGMKTWALERGASHFCHWFHPLTERVAEKHDAFLTWKTEGQVIENFTGKQLVQGEPDASSFPSGGLRSTFEARGYTVWDPASPPFLMGEGGNMTLYIPTAFIGYHGEALDHKTPHLRSMRYISTAACEALKLFGKDTKAVFPQVGPEQEYFLILKELGEQRMDITLTGRTLQGCKPAKGQELEDHYFGTIRPEVLDFMQEVERACYELGIPAKTRHNEVAPNQFEIAPIYERANVASDHNYILMRVLEQTADHHGLMALLHEKPFAGINGSGKHTNWSISTAEGENLLDPGHTPHENIQFLFFLAAVIRAVHRHGGLLGAAIARAGNDHRMGANEAPPNIVSVYLGRQLAAVADAVEKGGKAAASAMRTMDVGAKGMPSFAQDQTDRNRTSPFAFTGNKFEFRSPGSYNPIAFHTSVLNAAVGQAIEEMTAEVKAQWKKGPKGDKGILEVVRRTLKATRSVCFEGDNYSAEWRAEAARRGLPSPRNTPEALKAFSTREAKKLFKDSGVLSHQELEARIHVKYEQYAKWINIEAQAIADMASTSVFGAVVDDLGARAAAFENLADLKVPIPEPVRQALAKQAGLLGEATACLERLHEARAKADAVEDPHKKAQAYCAGVVPCIVALREKLDQLETVTDAAQWPYPRYWELLFH